MKPSTVEIIAHASFGDWFPERSGTSSVFKVKGGNDILPGSSLSACPCFLGIFFLPLIGHDQQDLPTF